MLGIIPKLPRETAEGSISYKFIVFRFPYQEFTLHNSNLVSPSTPKHSFHLVIFHTAFIFSSVGYYFPVFPLASSFWNEHNVRHRKCLFLKEVSGTTFSWYKQTLLKFSSQFHLILSFISIILMALPVLAINLTTVRDFFSPLQYSVNSSEHTKFFMTFECLWK